MTLGKHREARTGSVRAGGFPAAEEIDLQRTLPFWHKRRRLYPTYRELKLIQRELRAPASNSPMIWQCPGS